MFRKYKFPVACFTAGTMLLSANSYSQNLSATDLLNLLVQEGVITEDKAMSLVEKIRKRQQKSQQQLQQEAVTPAESTAVRVPYVPQTVKDEIRSAVRQDLRADVTQDVITHAKTERWGIPNALPEWINKVKINGDVRVRYQHEVYGDDNPSAFVDVADINDIGSTATTDEEFRGATVNTLDDRKRLRGRARLMLKAQPTQGFEVGMRFVSGNQGNPVSSNQTLGEYGAKWDTNMDLAYIKYTEVDKSLILHGGRFKNPFFHTDLVWDSDMTFEGVSGSWYWNRSDNMFDDFRQWDPFVTAGAFPIKEINQANLSTLNGNVIELDNKSNPNDNDIWLYGIQVGTSYDFINQNKIKAAISYYKFDNIQAVPNDFNQSRQDVTVPDFFQIGNTLQNIAVTDNPADQLYGLASDFGIVNATLSFDYAGFAPYHVIFTMDYIKNIGFDRDEVAERFSNLDYSDPGLTSAELDQLNAFPERDTGYQAGFMIGWPDLDQRDNWNITLKYRKIEADAMVDAFVDSDFLFGGTNAKGYIISGNYALDENVWTSLKWISADELDADVIENVKVDTIQLDVNAKF